MTAASPLPPPRELPGQRLARGVCRLLASHDFAALCEVVPARGLRVDVMALGPRGEIWVIECKSGPADLRADRKWRGYLDWCDRYFWAVAPDFPLDLLPDAGGLILADEFGGELVRMAEEAPLNPARRRSLTLRFARLAAWRQMGLADPPP
jgi:hypothetical protein